MITNSVLSSNFIKEQTKMINADGRNKKRLTSISTPAIDTSLSTKPVVTVICPIYNDANLVRHAIDSVLNQTFKNFEFIIFDNGSRDETRRVISDYNDSRIRIVKSHINLKSEIMVSLLSKVTTEFIAQIYSDDIWEPKKLELSLDKLSRIGSDAVFSNNSFIGDHGQSLLDHEVPPSQFVGDITSMNIDEHLHRFFFKGNTLHPVSMVIRTKAYHRIGQIRPYLHSIGDMEFFARLLLNGDVSFIGDRLQRIRIKASGRQNESAPSRASYLRVLGERMRFFEVMKSPQFLERLENVFFPELKSVVIQSELKKWFLGHQFMKLGDPDCNLIGMQTIYEAVDENYSEIEKYVVAIQGKTLGQYIEEIASRSFAVTADDVLHAQETHRLNVIIAHQDAALKQQDIVIKQQDALMQTASGSLVEHPKYQAALARVSSLEELYRRDVVGVDAVEPQDETLNETLDDLRAELAARASSTDLVRRQQYLKLSYAEDASDAAGRMISAGRWLTLPAKAVKVTFTRGPFETLKILGRLLGSVLRQRPKR